MSVVLVALLGGLIAGSFVSAVAYRVPRGLSIVGPRSICPDCGTQIAAYDNVPVVSWLLLGRHSRCCGEPIALRYPLTELTVGLLFAATAAVYRDELGGLALGMVLVSTLVAVTLTDLERRIIPNPILIAAALTGTAIAAIADPSSLPERAIAAAAAGGLFFAIVLAYPRGMGMGDVKLVAVMGLFLGRAIVPALLVALLAGSLVGFVMMAREGAGARKRAIPFGPFLALGGVVGLLAGAPLIDWYLGTFAS